MSVRDMDKTQLSKSILEMKFMKKTKEKVDRQMYQKEGEEYFGNQLLKPKKAGRFITEVNYVYCENLIEGRLSFQGENPELERLIELEELEKNASKIPEPAVKEADISDEHMAHVWKKSKINIKPGTNKYTSDANLNSSIEPKRKKFKFIKPEADDIYVNYDG